MESKVEQFVALTGVSPDVAQTYLEAANGDVEVAAGLFLESGSLPASPVSKPTTSTVPIKPVPRPQQPSRGGITGLADIRSVDPDDAKRDAYYAGGEKSGIAILDPSKHNRDEIVDKVFESAQKHGAVAKNEIAPDEKEKFGGVGYTLGNTVDQSKTVAPKPKPQGLKTVILTFWTDCFTVDDGPPRKFADPANAGFLNDVHKGVVPRELEALAEGADLNIELVKKGEEYKPPPKPKVVAFSGSGHSLGGESNTTGKKVMASKLVVVDESQPTTTIQVRLHDGGRLVIKCNHTHTLGDIRAHIEASKPSGKPMELRMTYPNKVLSDDTTSIKDAGLLNAAIVQRI